MSTSVIANSAIASTAALPSLFSLNTVAVDRVHEHVRVVSGARPRSTGRSGRTSGTRGSSRRWWRRRASARATAASRCGSATTRPRRRRVAASSRSSGTACSPADMMMNDRPRFCQIVTPATATSAHFGSSSGDRAAVAAQPVVEQADLRVQQRERDQRRDRDRGRRPSTRRSCGTRVIPRSFWCASTASPRPSAMPIGTVSSTNSTVTFKLLVNSSRRQDVLVLRDAHVRTRQVRERRRAVQPEPEVLHERIEDERAEHDQRRQHERVAEQHVARLRLKRRRRRRTGTVALIGASTSDARSPVPASRPTGSSDLRVDHASTRSPLRVSNTWRCSGSVVRCRVSPTAGRGSSMS